MRRLGRALIATLLAARASFAGPADTPAESFFDRAALTGDWAGLRSDLSNSGVALDATEVSELLGTVSGEPCCGTVYEGRLELDLDIDLDRIVGLHDATIHASAYQIHGRGLSKNYLANNLLTASNIEAARAFRLFDLWVQKGFFNGSFSVRLGQIAADDEFITSQYAAALINSTFGWPSIAAQALPSGGPAYPLATPGIRLAEALSNSFSVQFALFNGDPAGEPKGGVDPQIRNASGTLFSTDQDPLLILEAAYSPAPDVSATRFKIGAFYHTGHFDDLAVDSRGVPLLDPQSSGIPRRHGGNFGTYAVADWQLFRSDDQNRVAGLFARVGFVPHDRNFVSFYIDGGFAYKGPFAGRENDLASIGVAYARVSDQALSYDAALQQLTTSPFRRPDYEAVLEATYQVTLAPWWSLQPDLQYLFHPTQALVRPASAAGFVHSSNAAVVGVRSSLKF
jgi:porin